MSLTFGHTIFLLQPSTLHRRTTHSRQHCRALKRPRLKPLAIHNQLNSSPSPFDDLFHSLLSHFPSANSLIYIVPTLGLASGLARFFFSSSTKSLQIPKTTGNLASDIGEWILFTSPTPFNRFVTLRCPSICLPESELLENANERLVHEVKHYVKLNCGKMVQPVMSDGNNDENMVYQRVCVGTEDGGTLSLDWPANLDLEERELDTTVLIVPGTANGSNERKIRMFVYDCLSRGIFPVVMNPRGCAGSPLTTARLFTAADSDDISTTVQYINKKRSWTTLMGVGWGYGANMLTKYLAELGERTPLVAATCIDNPFDLEEAMRSTVYHADFDQRHTNGLIKILQCNKEIFQGRRKGFDVEKALSASSTQEFESAISMVSYGFDTIEDFYAKSSTRDVVGRVKVPVLFIQNDDGRVPMFSIPRNAIAENPYASLLLCAYSSSSNIMDDTVEFSWCLHLILEWLTAVELGLLKGRHPLLKDIDVTVNPSKGLEQVESRTSSKQTRIVKLPDLTNGNSTNPPVKMVQGTDTATTIQSRSAKDIGNLPLSTKRLQQEDNDIGMRSGNAVDAVVKEGANSSDDDRGQVLQTAQVVMKMLDMTMPDTLSDEQKKKVFNAVGQGETLIKAFQDAVPEDVRGKLTAAVSGFLQNYGSNLNFCKLINLGQIPDMASRLSSKVRLTNTSDDENVHSRNQMKTIDNSGDGSGKVDHSPDRPPAVMKQSSEISQRPSDTDMNQPSSNHRRDCSESEIMNMGDVGSFCEDEQLSGLGTTQISDREHVPEINANPSEVEESDDIIVDQKKVERENNKDELDLMEENNKHKKYLPDDQNKMSDAYGTEDKISPLSPTSEAENNQRKEEKDPMFGSSQNTGDSPCFSVSQALDALTRFDDSTQVAVNSVFHVIEGMIDRLEVDKDKENEVNNGNNTGEVNGVDKVKELSEGSEYNTHLMENGHKSATKMNLKINASTQSGDSDNTLLNDPAGSEYPNIQHYAHGEHNSNSSDIKNTRSQLGADNAISMVPAPGQLPAGNSRNFPSYVYTFLTSDPLYQVYLETSLYLTMRNTKSSMNKLPVLNLGYIPEGGQWKFLDQTEENIASVDKYAIHSYGIREDQTETLPGSKDIDNIVEPSYVILDSGTSQDQNEELKANVNTEFVDTEFEDSKILIKNLILECLHIEVGRRASAGDKEELELKLAREIEFVANAVSMAAWKAKMHMQGNYNQSETLGILNGEKIIKSISSALWDTQYLRRVLPVGVVVGTSLAALKKFFNVVTSVCNDEKLLMFDQVDKSRKNLCHVGEKRKNEILPRKRESKENISSCIGEEEKIVDLEGLKNNRVMVGAVTAALGASVLLAHQPNSATDRTSNEPLKEKEKENSKDPSKLDEKPVKKQNNIVTNLAEKAMYVANPVVPMKEDGEVDHERLVTMLMELGQKGGLFKLVGKVALLWGGIRGAMSLTEKLLSFMRIAERPLFQRILGFIFMVLLLWSPIVLPFLPILIQSWLTQTPLKFAEFACIAGLYFSIMIMVTLWGKRIRQYDDPILQYGLDLASVPKFHNFLKGLFGGVALVMLIHAVNSSIGCAHFSWPIILPLSLSSSKPVALIKSYGWMLMLIVQGVVTAAGVSVVEELLFRSWLPQEIAADFGFHRGIVIAGLLFALSQRSTWEIPGLWLLSLSLSGARERSSGSLSFPIGLRAGILASNLILRRGNFLTYQQQNFPLWVTGGHPFQPFSGAVGLVVSLVLAVILYPRQQPICKKKTTRVIRG
ncbi:hypothetical protein OROGR_017888 [Orobanche gracilis]